MRRREMIPAKESDMNIDRDGSRIRGRGTLPDGRDQRTGPMKSSGFRNIANDKVLFSLSFAAPDLRRPKAAYFPGKSVRIRRRLYSERQVFSDVHYKNGTEPLHKNTVFWILAGLHLLIFAACMLFGNIKYEVSDDFVMEMMLSGTYSGVPEARLLFGNMLWGMLLKPFYLMAPDVSWYFWGQMLLCLLSYLAVSGVLSDETDAVTALCASCLLSAFTVRDLYLLPQFTKTACAAVISGGVLFVHAVYRSGRQGEALCGALLAIFGSFVRFNTVYIAGAFLLIWFSACLFAEIRKGSRKTVLCHAGVSFALLGIIFLLSFAGRMIPAADPGYRAFYDYSDVRAKVIDYPWAPYEEYREEFLAAGVSANDYNMVLNWCLSDGTVFTEEMLEDILVIEKEYRKTLDFSPADGFREMRARKLHHYPGAICCLLLGFLLILRRPKAFWVPFAAGCLVIALFLYFHWIRRYVYRVEFCFFFSAAAVICCFFPRSAAATRDRILQGVCCFLTAAGVISQIQYHIPDPNPPAPDSSEYRHYIDDVFGYSWNFNNDRYTRRVDCGKLRPDFLAEVREHPERLYILDFQSTIQSLYYDFSPFDSASAVFPKNLVYLGGVTVQYPQVRTYAASLGLSDWLPGLTEQDVYLVCSRDTEWVRTYFKEHYGMEVSVQPAGEAGGYGIWKVLREK